MGLPFGASLKTLSPSCSWGLRFPCFPSWGKKSAGAVLWSRHSINVWGSIKCLPYPVYSGAAGISRCWSAADIWREHPSGIRPRIFALHFSCRRHHRDSYHTQRKRMAGCFSPCRPQQLRSSCFRPDHPRQQQNVFCQRNRCNHHPLRLAFGHRPVPVYKETTKRITCDICHQSMDKFIPYSMAFPFHWVMALRR